MRKLILTLIAFNSLLCSCNNVNDCTLPEQTVGSGEIITNAEVTIPSFGCIGENSEVVIQNDTSNTCGLKVILGDSEEEEIDFSKYTVLGNGAGGACNVSIDRNVTRDDDSKVISYNIVVHECGNCESYLFSENLVLVSKIPDDYEVNFSVLHED